MDFVWFFFAAAILLTIPMFFIFMKQIRAGDVPPPPAEDEVYAFESFDWGRLWVYDNGRNRASTGLPLLFLHSMGSSIFSWRHQLAGLPQERRIIAVDLPGFGRSEKSLELSYDLEAQAQRILKLLDTKNIPACHLVGCSLGGALALWLSAQHPERFAKTIVISPAASPELVPPLLNPELLLPVAKRLFSKRLVRAFLDGGRVHKHLITPEEVDGYYQPFLEPGSIECFFKSISIVKDPRVFEALPTIAGEVLVLWGEQDRVVKKPVIDKVLQKIPHAHLISHPEGGHHLMEDQPHWVNDQISYFLEGH